MIRHYYYYIDKSIKDVNGGNIKLYELKKILKTYERMDILKVNISWLRMRGGIKGKNKKKTQKKKNKKKRKTQKKKP
jgi:hypothetical protein